MLIDSNIKLLGGFYLKSPPLYTIRKFSFRDIIKSNYDLKIPFDAEKMYYINQQDNMYFRLVRLITGVTTTYNPYVIFVDCKGCRTYKEQITHIIRNGFTVNGVRYVITEKSASMSRNAILGFVDSAIEPEINRHISMDLQMKSTVICKYLAYRGLMFSSCFNLENWYPKVIVVDDYEKIVPNQLIKYAIDVEKEYIDKTTGEIKKYKEKAIKEGYQDVNILPFDGCGLFHPQIGAEIRERLGVEKGVTSVMIRANFIKGVIHEMAYDKFLESRGVSEIKDIWGVYHDASEPMIILTKSMYKGYKYFKNSSNISDWINYWAKFKEYNHCIGITKWNDSVEDEDVYKEINYQILQTLDLDYDDFCSLAEESVDWATKIVHGDKIYTNCFLGLYSNKHKPSNDYMKAILKNQKMLDDPCVRKYIKGLLTKTIDRFKCGRLFLRASSRILTPDLVMLMEYIGGMEPIGCLNAGEMYSRGIDGVCRGEWIIERNPHLSKSENCVLEGVYGADIAEYCSHLEGITMINGYDITLQRLNSADVDGDLVLTLQNDTIRKGIDVNSAVTIDTEDKITVADEEINVDNVVKSIIFSMDNRIGEYSNIATCYLNKTPSTPEQKDKYLGFVDLMSILNGKEIDSAKTGFKVVPPIYVSKYAKPLPYFMKYAGNYYRSLTKFNKGNSNMNRLCRDLEKWHKTLKYKTDVKDFDHGIMLNYDLYWDDAICEKIEQIYLEFSKESKELAKQQSMMKSSINYHNYFQDLSREEIVNTKVNFKYYYEPYIKRCLGICSDVQMLANYAVYICYEKYPKRDKNFAWIVAKDGIVKNIKQEKVFLPKEDETGKFEYLGKKIKLVEANIFA